MPINEAFKFSKTYYGLYRAYFLTEDEVKAIRLGSPLVTWGLLGVGYVAFFVFGNPLGAILAVAASVATWLVALQRRETVIASKSDYHSAFSSVERMPWSSIQQAVISKSKLILRTETKKHEISFRKSDASDLREFLGSHLGARLVS